MRYRDDTKKGTPYKSRLIPSEISKHGKKAREQFAEDWRAELNKELIESPVAEVDPTDMKTVDEMVYQYLDYQLSIGEIDPGTHYRNLSHYNKRISPIIGNYGFKSVDRFTVMDLYEKLNAEGLSQNTIYHYVKIVAKVYRYYHKLGDIPFNPFDQVKKAKRSYKTNVSYLTQEQTDQLFEALDDEYEPYSPMYTAVYFMFYAGLRRGEICGLRWNNIDLSSGRITIDTAIGTTKGRKLRKRQVQRGLLSRLCDSDSNSNVKRAW